ncbi:MAG TPA: hypothetical protein VN420_01110, partial [Candidatus Fimivivens sp.]|nr:hypothetical protein [Candidatus Fimivivens sp.]
MAELESGGGGGGKHADLGDAGLELGFFSVAEAGVTSNGRTVSRAFFLHRLSFFDSPLVNPYRGLLLSCFLNERTSANESLCTPIS